MRDSRDRPPDGADLRHALRELTTVERRTALATAAPREASPGQEAPPWPEFSVETDTVNGMHSVIAITAFPPHDDDAPAEAESAALRSLVRSLLDLAGHESGPANTTVALTGAGPHVVTCRLGSGGAVPGGSRAGSRGR